MHVLGFFTDRPTLSEQRNYVWNDLNNSMLEYKRSIGLVSDGGTPFLTDAEVEFNKEMADTMVYGNVSMLGGATLGAAGKFINSIISKIGGFFGKRKGEAQWFNPNGSMNYPPNNGAVAGTEVTITLQPGQTLGRYGTISDNSNFVTAPGANPSSLSLPPNTSGSIYSEYQVIKQIPNTVQSTVAPWGGSTGGGLQYQLPMPIQQLINDGYIK